MSTRAEVCAVACAELFRDAGEIMVSPMTNMASVGARLARLTFSPGRAQRRRVRQQLRLTVGEQDVGGEGQACQPRADRGHVGHRADHDLAGVSEQVGAGDRTDFGSAGTHFDASSANLRTAA